MTPHDFIAKWKHGGDERRDFQPFFEDLCRMLGHKTPREADPEHEWFTYEYGATKTSGGNGWADVWKRGFFGWEAKGTHKDLAKAYQQLKMYADALENPPLLIVSDLRRFEIHTNFTSTVKKVYAFTVEDLADPATRRVLAAAFNDPQQLKPGTSRAAITEEAAKKFAEIAEALRDRGHDPHAVAHFLNRLLFCMFAEDIGLLPEQIFTKVVTASEGQPDKFESRVAELFAAMKDGGEYALNAIEWFNGGLFEDASTLRLETQELATLQSAARLDWSEIDPSIFGTLFERGLDPNKRSQLGAHYTDPTTIMKIVRPVVVEPWLAEWEREKAALTALMKKAAIFGDAPASEAQPTAALTVADKKAAAAKHTAKKAAQTKAHNEAQKRLREFLERFRAFRVLDPACGSGNFLFLALRSLKDLEQRIMVEAEALGLPRQAPAIGPANVLGIELNEYAAELARITVWIGEIQWMIANGHGARRNPILQALGGIENRDALLNDDGTEAAWPQADAIVGNPPFLGSRKMKPELGADYVEALRKAYQAKVPKGADLVCFWFAKAWAALQNGATSHVGLVATNSITGGASRKVLEPIASANKFSDVWPDEPWVLDGAAVRVCVSVFTKEPQVHRVNGELVERIASDLRPLSSAQSLQPDKVAKLQENTSVAFQGVVLRSNVNKKTAEQLGLGKASFAASKEEAQKMLSEGGNPNGKPNSDVVVPLLNGDDLTGRPSDRFVVDFVVRPEHEAAMYELPFRHIQNVKHHRAAMGQAEAVATWWQHWRPRPDMRRALRGLPRFLATSAVAKHRVWSWVPSGVLTDHALIVVARADDTTLGVLQSRAHELWALRMGTRLGVGNDPRYTPTTTFETFPFPEGLTPNIAAADYASHPHAQAIAAAARELVEKRNNWLNPAEWVDWVRTPEEEAAGFPARPVAKTGHEAALKKRTLTNLYNERPTWLENLHDALDKAVAAAYGWPWPLAEDEILRRLFALNQERAK